MALSWESWNMWQDLQGAITATARLWQTSYLHFANTTRRQPIKKLPKLSIKIIQNEPWNRMKFQPNIVLNLIILVFFNVSIWELYLFCLKHKKYMSKQVKGKKNMITQFCTNFLFPFNFDKIHDRLCFGLRFFLPRSYLKTVLMVLKIPQEHRLQVF